MNIKSIIESNDEKDNKTINFYLDNEMKIKLHYDGKGNIKKLLYCNGCNSDNAFNLVIKKNLSNFISKNEENIKILIHEKNNPAKDNNTILENVKTIQNRDKINSLKKIEMEKIFLAMNDNKSINENDDNLSILSGNSDIGINEEDFVILLAIICQNIRPKNIKIKYMPSLSDTYVKNYFEISRPSYKEFIEKLEIDESDNNIMLIIPLSCLDHFSLMLVHNYEIYLLDYGLVHSSDDEYLAISNKSEELYKKLINLNFQKFNELDIIIKNILNNSELNLENEINLLTKAEKEEIIEIIRQYIEVEIKISKKFILNAEKCYGDISTFYNENLCKMINSLNNFSIQGSQTCSYFCIASMILIAKKGYNIKNIIDLTHKGIFQILTIKILLEKIFMNTQNIFIINNNEIKKEYEIFKSNDYTILIRKDINYIYIKSDNKLLKFKPEIILDMENIKKMLISKGFYVMNK